MSSTQFPLAARRSDGSPVNESIAQILARVTARARAPRHDKPAKHRAALQHARTFAVVITESAPTWVRAAARRLAALRRGHVHALSVDPAKQAARVRRWLERDGELQDYVLVMAPPSQIPFEVEWRLSPWHLTGRLWFEQALVHALWPGRTQARCVERYIDRLETLDRAPADGSVLVSTPFDVGDPDEMERFLVPPVVKEAGGAPNDLLRRPPAETLLDRLADGPQLWCHLGHGHHTRDDLQRGALALGGPGDAAVGPTELVRGGARGRVAMLLACYAAGTTSEAPVIDPLRDLPGGEPKRQEAADVRVATARSHLSGLAHALLGGDDGFGAVIAPLDVLYSTAFDPRGPYAADSFPRTVRALRATKQVEVGRALARLRYDEASAHRDLFPLPGDCPEGSAEHALRGIRWLNLRHTVVLGDPMLYA